jgi:hypothetical protein
MAEDKLSDIIESLRKGDIKGTVIITLKGKDTVIKIKTKTKHDKIHDNTPPAQNQISQNPIIDNKSTKITLDSLENRDFSDLEVSGSNMKGISLSGSRFVNTIIKDTILSYSNFYNADFAKARISQTDMSNAYNVNLKGAYLTGSVNLYQTHSQNTMVPPFDYNSTPIYSRNETPVVHHPQDANRMRNNDY